MACYQAMPSSPLGFSPENYPVCAEEATFPIGFSPENAPVRTEDATIPLGFSPEHSRVCTADVTSGEPAPLTESASPGSTQALPHAPQSHAPPAFVEQAQAPTDMPTVQRLFPEVVAPMVIEVFAGSARLSQACQAVGFRLSYCKYKSLFFTENFRIFMMRKFRLSVLGKL